MNGYFKEMIINIIVDSSILEQAFRKKDAERRIEGLAKPIYLHLVKILYWEDRTNYQKHINDIDKWLFDIDDIKIKPKNKSLQPKFIYDWLFDMPYGDLVNVKNAITKHLKEYKK